MRPASRLSTFIFLATCSARIGSPQSNSLTVTPSPVVFCGQPGQAISAIPVTVTASGAQVTFIATSVTSEGNWLVVEPSFSSVTPGQPFQFFLLGMNSSFIPFADGDYPGQIVLGGLDGARLATIPVLLQVSAAGCGALKSGSIFANSGPITFQLPAGSSSTEVLSLFNTFRTNLTVIPIPSTATGLPWLSTTLNNLSLVTGILYPTPFAVAINTQSLSPGATYAGNIELDSSNAAILNIPLTLNVNSSGSTRFAATPSPLSLGVRKGTGITSANIQLTNLTPAPVGVSVSITQAGNRNWLTVSPASTQIPPNGTISLIATISGAGLLDGPNQGSINVQVPYGSGGSLVIPVTIKYGIDSELAAAPNPLSITAPAGSASPVDQVLTVSSNSGVVSFSANTFSSPKQPWLSVKPYFSTISPGKPANLAVTVQPALLPAGPAIGVVVLTRGDGSTALTIPVNVNSAKDLALSVMPVQLYFSYTPGLGNPVAQTLDLATPAPSSYTVQASTFSGGNWLLVNPLSAAPSGGAPVSLTAQVNPGVLSPNTYQGQIVVTNTASGAQQTVPVTLTVSAPLALSVDPALLTFNYQPGGPSAPPPQSVQVSTMGGSSTFSATTAGLNGAPDFLTVNTPGSSTPSTLLVGLNNAALAALPAGEYSGTVTISTPGIPGGSQTIAVRLIVSQPGPRITSIVNSASLAPGPVSPGEIVTITGLGLGPSNTTVTFDGYAAPVIYADAEQINAIVPYEIAGQSLTSLVVTSLVVSRNATASLPLSLRVADTVPAIFSATQTGNGQGAILNADSTYNNANNPAAAGSVIQIFATGEGAYPGAITGSVSPLQPLQVPVAVTIGGQPAELQYAGEAPGLIAGILQVNAVVPANLGSGPQPVVLTIAANSNNTQKITVSIQ